jgi:hypothetical protein
MKETEQIKLQSDPRDSSPEQSPTSLDYLILQRELACGCSRDQAKRKWGPLFNERAWDNLVQGKAPEQSGDKQENKSAQQSPIPGSNMQKLNAGYLFEIYGDKPFMVRPDEPYTNLFPNDPDMDLEM